LLAVLASLSVAAETPKVSLDNSETLFTVLTAINACGYDQELDSSNAVRREIRAEVARAISSSEETAAIAREMCSFYQEHQQQDASHELSQYISLALSLEGPPNFLPKTKTADLPPDATRLLGIGPLLAKFYSSADLHLVWLHHRDQYESLIDRYHQPLSKMMFDTDIYLRLPSSGYLGRQFLVYLEPMAAPSQINARVYGTDYYVVISPVGSDLKMEQIRHTYLHYVLEPLAMKRPDAMKRLSPLLDAVRTAPMEQSYKDDISLLVTECLIRAVEARTSGGGKGVEQERAALVDKSVQQGFILTAYFYQELSKFEKGPTGFRDEYGDLLNGIDVRSEMKRANNIAFSDAASPDVLFLPPHRGSENLLGKAEQRLSVGDAEGAQKLAQEALDDRSEDAGRALFILAQVATRNRDINGARQYFQQAIGAAKEPKIVAWSHIYLGRIFDLQENRDAALDEYRAALAASNAIPEAKAAAEKGIQQAYEPPVRPQPQAEDDQK
jgi:hypothetical protein